MRTYLLSGLLILAVTLQSIAQQTNQLEVLKQAYEKQEQALLAQYDKALDGVTADLKKKGDLDNVLILQAEQKRFEAEKTVPTVKDAKDAAYRSAAESYHKAMATLLGKYVTALDGLIKKEVVADRIEEAKAVKEEKEKIALILADAEARIPAVETKATKSVETAGTSYQATTGDKTTGGRISTKVSPEQALKAFDFPNDTWKVTHEGITGVAGDSTAGSTIWYAKTLDTTEFDYSFRIKADWYHMMEVEIDDTRYVFSRGHWGNTRTLFFDGRAEEKLDGTVNEPDKWHQMRVRLFEGTMTFYYDNVETKKRIIGRDTEVFKVRLGFNSYQKKYSIKDICITFVSP